MIAIQDPLLEEQSPWSVGFLFIEPNVLFGLIEVIIAQSPKWKLEGFNVMLEGDFSMNLALRSLEDMV